MQILSYTPNYTWNLVTTITHTPHTAQLEQSGLQGHCL